MPPFNFTISSLAIKDVIGKEKPPATIHTIEQCFVDLNMELNENINSVIPKKSVSFRGGLYTLSEGSGDTLYVELDSPSTLGIEEVDLTFLGSSGPNAVINQDLVFSGTNFAQPVRLSWGVGE